MVHWLYIPKLQLGYQSDHNGALWIKFVYLMICKMHTISKQECFTLNPYHNVVTVARN